MGSFRMRALAPWLVLTGAVLCGSCGDEITYEVVPAGTGALRIDVEPAPLDAPWSLTLPSGATASGSGSAFLPSMPAGTYTIAWGDVADWVSPSPNPHSEILEAGAELGLLGEYIYAPPLGSIVVDVQPDDTYAPWSLSGPDGYALSGQGDRTLAALPLGEYTLIWGEVAFYFTPEVNPVTGQLGESEPLMIAGVYSPDDSIDRVGIYADSLGTVRAVTIEPNTIVTVYIVAHLPSLNGELLSVAEFAAPNWFDPGAAGLVELQWVTDLLIGSLPDGIAMALVEPLPADENDNIVLGTARILSLDAAWPPASSHIEVQGWHEALPEFAPQGGDAFFAVGDALRVNPTAPLP